MGENGKSDRCYFKGSKITADGDCSYEIKRHLLLGRKAMTKLDSVLKKQRHHFADKNPCSQSYDFPCSHVRMWELDHKRSLSTEEFMLSNCGAGKDSWESLRHQGNQIGQSQKKSTLTILWKDWCWSWSSNSLATWCKEPTHWKGPWYWERLRARGEAGDRG